ncbi:uncharacterized protein LOC113233665 [Hyposmocoma kahamanoa]|uniref:uncharacterized protein LOC113233665 n=1 Tax=Hyposmocoma kahamanoa TaxID=1477025 RepID=UPI000E6D7C04|nr:uncharacterized protein LOC113233665 [Hyposmocoma kahamanoa]
MKIYLFLTALTCLWSAANSRKVVWTLPLDQAKVIYHHQKICLTVKGVENCIKKDKEPGDPQELAKMFSIVHEYESGGDGDADAGTGSAEVESLHDFPDTASTADDDMDDRTSDDDTEGGEPEDLNHADASEFHDNDNGDDPLAVQSAEDNQ